MPKLNEYSTFDIIKMIEDDHIATELMRRFNQPTPKSEDTLILENRVIKLEKENQRLKSKEK